MFLIHFISLQVKKYVRDANKELESMHGEIELFFATFCKQKTVTKLKYTL